MKVKDLKLMLFVDIKKEVVLKSENNNNYNNLIYKDWNAFIYDENVDDLILEDYFFAIMINQDVITIWVK